MADFDSSLPVRTEAAGDVITKICDATTTTQQLAIDSNGRITVNQGTNPWTTVSGDNHDYGTVSGSTLRTASQIGNATGAADFDFGAASAQTLRVAALVGNASGLANFGAGTTSSSTLRTAANLYDDTGTAFGPTNPLSVVVTNSPSGAHINDFKTESVAATLFSNHDYTVTALKTLLLSQVEGSASGKSKMIVQTETGIASNVFDTRFVLFNSTATPNMSLTLSDPISVTAGVRVRIVMYNYDKQTQDVYSTISGTEA